MNWVFCAAGLAYSLLFLIRNLYVKRPNSPSSRPTTDAHHSYPVLSATEKKTSKILLIIVVVLHVGFALAIKILFFA